MFCASELKHSFQFTAPWVKRLSAKMNETFKTISDIKVNINWHRRKSSIILLTILGVLVIKAIWRDAGGSSIWKYIYDNLERDAQ